MPDEVPRLRSLPCDRARTDWERARLRADDSEPRAVLVIDDDPDLANTLAEALVSRGYRAAGVRDGKDVIDDPTRIIEGVGPVSSVDVLVTDYVMLRSSGLDVLVHARASDWPVAIVIMSAFVNREMQTEALALGARAVLAKPFELEELVGLVESIAPLDQPTSKKDPGAT